MSQSRFLTLVLMLGIVLLLPAAGARPPSPASAEVQAELEAAFWHRLQTGAGNQPLTFELFTPELDTAFISPDGTSAVLWLALRDDNGRILATEPGLVLARRSGAGWQVLLPGDPGWQETLDALPEGMLPLEQSPAPQADAPDTEAVTGPLTGYYLPYAAGTARWLEGSISHFQYIPELGYPSCAQEYCAYAYDFTDSWHFPLLAAKGGTVYASRDSCSDGNPSCTNFITLYNASEGTYQIYLHLAYNTIPNKLTAGRQVLRGEYLGDSDDTGYSTSQHVHFMVTKSVWLGGDGYYWGRSVDIRFADVAINNGIPRNCYEVTHFPIYDGASECLGDKADPRNPANDWYVSGNVGAYPPTGTLSRPAPGAPVAVGDNPGFDVTANASDDVAVSAVRLVAWLDGAWVEIGPKVTKPLSPGVYDWDVDLCAAAPVNGALDVALRVWDHEGNVASALDARTVQVEHACPPPVSELNPAQSFDSTAVLLDWQAAGAGAGLGSFELQWRSQPNAWEMANLLSVSGARRATWFAGEPGGTYDFRLRALDSNNQAEPWPAGDEPETSASLPLSCVPDAFEPDDEPGQARLLSLGEQVESNLCEAGDADWFQVEIEQVQPYFISAPSISGGAAVQVTIYLEDQVSVLASGQALELGQGALLRFEPEAAGTYYIKIEGLTQTLMGTQAVYGLRVSAVRELFLPLLSR